MKYAVAIALFLSFLALTNAQESSAKKPIASQSIALRIGEKAPLFMARDQFDHEQSNETLRGSNGTVLLFFRSADW